MYKLTNTLETECGIRRLLVPRTAISLSRNAHDLADSKQLCVEEPVLKYCVVHITRVWNTLADGPPDSLSYIFS